jgi:hypothetical protein
MMVPLSADVNGATTRPETSPAKGFVRGKKATFPDNPALAPRRSPESDQVERVSRAATLLD